jgi:hypothetical protein
MPRIEKPHKVVLPIMCSECMAITAFDVPRKSAVGATYDCKCGRVMLIKGNLTTVDLYEQMGDNIRAMGIDPTGMKAGYVELS